MQGHKVGLTSAAMQRLLGVTEPDYGHLLDDFFHLEHMPIPIDLFVQPRIEPEVAFVLKKPLKGPGVTVHEALRAVDFVLPALEIVDSRIRDWKIGLFDTIADNASSGAVVLGSTPTDVGAVDLRLAGATFHRNGEVVGTGAGGAVLGSPLNSLVWLANTVGARGRHPRGGRTSCCPARSAPCPPSPPATPSPRRSPGSAASPLASSEPSQRFEERHVHHPQDQGHRRHRRVPATSAPT